MTDLHSCVQLSGLTRSPSFLRRQILSSHRRKRKSPCKPGVMHSKQAEEAEVTNESRGSSADDEAKKLLDQTPLATYNIHYAL